MSHYSDMTRRDFMQNLTLLGGLALTFPTALLAENRQQQQMLAAAKWQASEPWVTIMQVQEVLFPAADDTPGAKDILAANYLYQSFKMPGNDDQAFIFRGVGWLNDLSKEQHKKVFIRLSLEQQNSIISRIVKSRAGRNWVSTLVSYIIEALLADPVYGGNPNGIGWKWLAHQPGYPRPGADKTWSRLQQRRYKA